MRAAFLCTALAVCGLGGAAPAQDMMRHIDLTSPEMVSAEMTRADVEARLAGTTAENPADFTARKLSGLDLSGLDFSGAVFRAARLNKTNLAGARLDRAILDQAWLIEADLSRASLQGAALFAAQMQRARL
ncbi:MAG: pentapeptide repeat-containing protein, partial [Xanthobacteraceae bacterium]